MAGAITVKTTYRREMMCKVTSGAISTVPAIATVAFGTGGVDSGGNVLSPSVNQTTLNNEVGRYVIDGVTYPETTTARYTVSLPANTLPDGTAISEAALVDSGGNFCAVCNMHSKEIDSGVEFVFTFDDEF